MATLEIITGPAGAGKSAACRARLRECPDSWLILPSEEQRARWRRALPEWAQKIKTVHELAHELAAPGRDGGEVVTPAFRLLILRHLIQRETGPDSPFARVAETAGFARCLADLFSQLRQAETDAAMLASAIGAAASELADDTFVPKGEEIARLLCAYEQYLRQHRLLDAEDVLARAICRVREAPDRFPWPEEVVVDGFREFRPQQLSLFQALAARVGRLTFTLTHDAARPVLFAHTAEALRRLRERFPDAALNEPTAALEDGPSTCLGLLESRLFRSEAPLPPPDAAVTLFEAPDTRMQVEMVAREIRRLLDRDGFRPGEIGLLARSVAPLAPVIRSVFACYEIPVWLRVGERLGENPFVACAGTLLRIWLRDWQRDDLLRFLRSSYLGLSRFAVDAFERRARRQGVQRGRARWLHLAASGETDAGLHTALCSLAEAQDRLREARSPAAFREMLLQAIGDLGLLAGLDRGEPLLVRADRCAWEDALRVLEDLSRLDELAGRREGRFETLAAAALSGWEAGFFNQPADEDDRVQVVEAYDTRGHEFRAAFVLDLVEGVFPRRPREDPCFRDDERRALARHGVALPLSLAQADEDRLLFYQAVTAPRERLWLCYPKTDGDGRVTLRSFFLDEVDQAFAPLPRKAFTLSQTVPGPDEAVLPRERLACLAAALGDGQQPGDPGAPPALRDLCAHLREELPAEVERLLAAPDPRRPYHLSQPEVRAHWSRRRGATSVSELESAVACPFQHHMAHRLRLDAALEDREALDRGQVLHEVLRRFFEEVRASGFPERAEAAARLRRLCREQFEQTPIDARPYRLRLAERALERSLERFVERERQFRESTTLEPFLLEFAFGPQAGLEEKAAEAPSPLDARGPVDGASTRQPLVLRVGDRTVRLSGKIDRIDRTPGGHAFVFDYKLGKARKLAEMQEGRSLQMPVYWLAVEQLLGLIVVGGAYDALREGERKPIARCDLADHAFSNKGILGKNAVGKIAFEQLLEQTRLIAIDTAAQIERLEIAPAPADARTCSFCRFQDCCRPEEAGIAFDREAEGGPNDE